MFISLTLNFSVFKKTGPNFPVVLRTNDFGINFLANRYALWQTPLLGIILILINSVLSYFLKRDRENLSKLLFFANIGIGFLLLVISLQVYFLNR
ncbi:MAG: hypothetical protein ACP5PR_00310 [Minisyncoccia bacterium]